ncbi:hypothetical protein J422_05035 [Methanocaldococcus villosus KIN24-T80]|uniref:Permease n=1 Tax=Methanocaldococcus villosus KIN24-T80 TaxID=1069083 RepID=N6UUG0_9EURY|nr:AI-2E family transporter [Methanocaldococcus villosus]ENN95979.1 hypothetical protein J422_05035 [Methanocaldococcus villosus KIN24-T80]
MRYNEFKYLIKIIIIVLILSFFYFIFPYIDVIAYAIVFSYMALPIYNFIYNISKNRNLASILAVIIFVLPIILIGLYIIWLIVSYIINLDIGLFISYYKWLVGKYRLDNIINDEFIKKYGEDVIKYIVSKISSSLLSLGNLFIKILIIIFMTFYFLKDGYHIKDIILNITPHDYRSRLEIYLMYLHETYKNIFISCVNISIIITALAYIGYKLTFSPYPELLAIITGIFALLPILGSWMVYGSLALYYFLINNYYSAIFILIYGVIFLNLVPDFILRPYLVKKDTDIHPVLVIIAFLIAPLSLGVVGFAIGPLVIGALYALYLAKYRDKKI